jgi:CheY-like chemotaxis protein
MDALGHESATVLRKMLTGAGLHVMVAENGALGMEAFQQWRPHSISMGLGPPQLSRAEATRRIRQLRGGRQAKIVALPASAFAQQQEEVLVAGLDEFLRKPYRREEIFDCVTRHLGVSFQYREAAQSRLANVGLLTSCAKRYAYSQILDTIENCNGSLRQEAHDGQS